MCHSIGLGGTCSETCIVLNCVDENITKFKFFIEAFCLRVVAIFCYTILYSAPVPIHHFYDLAFDRGCHFNSAGKKYTVQNCFISLSYICLKTINTPSTMVPPPLLEKQHDSKSMEIKFSNAIMKTNAE